MGLRAPFSVEDRTNIANSIPEDMSRLAIRKFAKKQMSRADEALAKNEKKKK